jgi:septal ring factor EnvC (AmiA/AmiB activator)
VNDHARRLHAEVLALMPQGASHDRSACPFCAETARLSETPPAGTADRSDTPDDTDRTEGGSTPAVDVERITQETHEALVRAAVEKATSDIAQERDRLRTQLDTLTTEHDAAKAEAAGLTEETERLQKELDDAQVQLKATTEAKAGLETQLAEREEAARLAEQATVRASQVRNLGLFTEEQIVERATRWAAVADEEWAERIEEWKTVRSLGGGREPAPATETASAFSGSNENAKPAANTRRRVLGLGG